MSQPAASFGRPVAPAPGAAAPELRIARVRPQARGMVWPAVLLIALAGAVGYFSGNLPEPFTDVMLWSAAGIVVLLLVVLPYLRWLAHAYTITTRRVIETSGLLVRRRGELSHIRGYAISETRGPLQRLGRSGTLTLSNGVDPSLRLRNIPNVSLVHEVLADQVEVSQILAHRDSHSIPTIPPES